MASESETSSDEEVPPFKLVSKNTFHRLAELAPAAAHNQPLTEAELQVVNPMQEESRLALNTARLNIERIDAQINALHRQKRILTGEAATQESVLQLCSKLKSPIRRAPKSVIREIALYCAPTSLSLAFAQVCSLWRVVALSTPRVWSTLHLRITRISSLDRYSQLVLEWSKRARGIPRTLILYFLLSGSVIANGEKELRRFLASISPSLTCVHHLGILSSRLENLRSLFDAQLEWDLPTLRQLDIQSIHPRDPSVSLPAGHKLFNSTPTLTNLILDSIIGIGDAIPSVIPWVQLSRVCVSKPATIHDFITVIRLCTSLKKAVFTLAGTISTLTTPPLIHSHLENLSLEIAENSPQLNFFDVLNCISLPFLKKLDLIGPDETSPVDQPSLAIVESAPRLQEFPHLKYLSISGTNELESIQILSRVPGIRELTLAVSQRLPTNLLRIMTYGSGRISPHSCPSEHILPSLSTFRIDISDESLDLRLEDDTIFRRMIFSRVEALPTNCRRLEHVIVDSSSRLQYFFQQMAFQDWCLHIGVGTEVRAVDSDIPAAYVPCPDAFSNELWDDDQE